MNFVAHAKLFDQPDPRRLDLRASISNLRRDWLVRVNQQRASINISVIVDVSASMHFGAPKSKLDVAADFIAALGFSAGAMGDAVSLLAFDQHPREDLAVPLRFGRGNGLLMAQTLRACTPAYDSRPASVDALAQCIELTAQHSALVFICSDFHWPLENLPAALDPLGAAMVVPMVIWDRAEVEPPDGRQLLSAQQIGRRTIKHLWLNGNSRRRWKDNVQRREQLITELFSDRQIKPFMLRSAFDPEQLSQYFMSDGI